MPKFSRTSTSTTTTTCKQIVIRRLLTCMELFPFVPCCLLFYVAIRQPPHPSKPTSWERQIHVIIVIISVFLLLWNALLVLVSRRSGNIVYLGSFSLWLARTYSLTRTQLHAFLNAFAWLFCALGVLVEFIDKYVRNKDHYTTWHAWFGLAFLCLFTLQALIGALLYVISFKIGFPRYLVQRRLCINRVHGVMGMMIYFLAFITLILSLYSKWFLRMITTRPLVWYVAMVCVCICGIATLSVGAWLLFRTGSRKRRRVLSRNESFRRNRSLLDSLGGASTNE